MLLSILNSMASVLMRITIQQHATMLMPPKAEHRGKGTEEPFIFIFIIYFYTLNTYLYKY